MNQICKLFYTITFQVPRPTLGILAPVFKVAENSAISWKIRFWRIWKIRSQECSWEWIIGSVTWGSLGQGSRGSVGVGVMDSSRLWWFREYICETGFDRNTPHVFRSDIHSDPQCDTVHWNEASIKPSHLGCVGWVTFFLKNQVLIWWLNSHGIEYTRQN